MDGKQTPQQDAEDEAVAHLEAIIEYHQRRIREIQKRIKAIKALDETN